MKTIVVAFLFLPFAVTDATFAQVLTPPEDFTHTAAANGSWDSSTTWGGQVPADGAIVRIPQFTTVVLTTQETSKIEYIQVEGVLEISVTDDTRLPVDTLYITSTGSFLTNGAVPADKQSEIVFISDGNPIDRSWDPEERSRGLVSQGVVSISGAAKTNMARLAGDAPQGAASLDLELPVPADWYPGDEIVVAGTQFQRHAPLEDEVVTIQSVAGNVISLDESLQFPHLRADPGMNIHVANLTRNVIFRSESTDIPLRGHAMFLSPDVDIRYAAFVEMGRTDKRIPLDEIIVDLDTGSISPNPDIQNRRGRYPVHFHLNGTSPGQDPPSEIEGCVVQGTPGWGFVNHSSHVDFSSNVCYDFAGSGFVTEAGDELGDFYDNIAIHGTGVPGMYFPIRNVFRNDDRPQPLSDFAFGGDGFWFQGPALRVRNNVASSCNGTGMFWFGTGAVNIDNNEYVGFPTSDISAAYAGYPDISSFVERIWDYAGNPAVIADLPILEMDGFDGYACLVGFRQRFVNMNRKSFYREDPYDYHLDIQDIQPEGASLIRQSVENLRLWNNEQGFRVRYNKKTDWVNVKNVNRLRFDDVRKPYAGAEFFHQADDQNFTNLLIDGYALAGWIECDNNVDKMGCDDKYNRSQIEFEDQAYLNYANFDAGIGPCSNVAGVTAFKTTPASAAINWDSHLEAERFLVRYRALGDVPWEFTTQTDGAGTDLVLDNLSSGQGYEYQVIAGCFDQLGEWSVSGTFSDDTDGDGVLDYDDNCPTNFNPEQLDIDGDGLGDLDLQNETVSSTELLEICGSITAGSNFRIADAGDVALRAGTKIVLRSGFSIGSVARLGARIEAP